MPLPAQPLDQNYKPITNDLYDSVGKQFVTAQAGTTTISGDGTVYAPTITQPGAPYPLGATPITAASGDVAAATATATLAAVAGKTTYITGFSFSSTGASGISTVDLTITGTITGTLTFVNAIAGVATTANPTLIVNFPHPIPASAVNTAIVVSIPSLGAGNLHSAVNAYGFQL